MKNLFLATFILASVSCKSQQVQTATTNARTISVTGVSEKKVVPDIIEFTLTLKEYYKEELQPGRKYEDYKTRVPMTEIEPEVLNKLKKIGIKSDQIKVKNVGNYYRPAGKDFLVSKTLVITVSDLKLIDQISKEVVSYGISNMFISDMRHSKQDEFEKEVKIASLKNAQEKAKYLCESLGEKCGKAIAIREQEFGTSNPPITYATKMEMNYRGDASAKDVVLLTISYTMYVTFLIEE